MSYEASTTFTTQFGLRPVVTQWTDSQVRIAFVEDEVPSSVASLALYISNAQFAQLMLAIGAYLIENQLVLGTDVGEAVVQTAAQFLDG